MSIYNPIINFIKYKFKDLDKIPLHQPVFNGNEKKYLVDTIDSTYVSSIGPYVDRFERMMLSLSKAKKAIAVVNGTSGLQIALKLVGVEKGDEVITQALTFVATANAITYNGATPIFLDVDLDTMGLSPFAVESFLEEYGDLRENATYNKLTGKKISACLPMHTFGFPVHFNEIKRVCTKWKIPIVEDAAEALGSEYDGQSVGSLGDIGVFSLNGNKIITSGGGGAIVTNCEHLGIRGKHLTTTAKVPHSYNYYHDEIGYNFRMPNLNAALACAQLEQIKDFTLKKRHLAEEYQLFFSKTGIKFRTETPNTKANYWLMCVELENKKERNSFLNLTNNNGIMTRPIWTLMFRLPMYQNSFHDSQKNARFLEDRIVNIPSNPI